MIDYFDKLHKSWIKDETPPAMNYQGYPQDENLPAARILDEYCRRHMLRFDGGREGGILFLPISKLLGLTCAI